MKFIILGLMACASLVHGATVVLVTTNTTNDAGLIAALQAAGHTVTTGAYASIDSTPADVATLNAAALVIVSRNTNSGNYATNAAEVAAWDALTTRVLLGNAYLARDSRWKWATDTALQTNYSGDVTAPSAAVGIHPVYTGLTPNGAPGAGFAGEDKYLFQTTATVDVVGGNNTIAGTGTMIGVRNNATNQRMIIAEWAAGGTTGSGNTLAGQRMFLAMPEQYVDLNANGELMIDNAVAYLVPEPSSTGLGFIALAMGLGIRRRS